jgi:hypothetical protein
MSFRVLVAAIGLMFGAALGDAPARSFPALAAE